MNSSKWLEMKVVELSYRGHNYREISDQLQISTGKISKILHKLNESAREEIKGWIDSKAPFEYQKSLMLITYLQKQTIKLVESTKDERVQLEGVRALADLDGQKRQLLCDSFVINSAISTLQKQKKHELIINANKNSTFSRPARDGIKHQANTEASKQNDLDTKESEEATHETGDSNAER